MRWGGREGGDGSKMSQLAYLKGNHDDKAPSFDRRQCSALISIDGLQQIDQAINSPRSHAECFNWA